MFFESLLGRKSRDKTKVERTEAEEFEPPSEEAPSASTDSADADKDAIRQMNARASAYEDYNRRKIYTIEARLGDLDRDILRLLPALIHLNLDGLPGYIAEQPQAPGGIWNFRVKKDLADLLRKHFPNVHFTPLSLRRPGQKNQIYSLAAMGSLGTIAQTGKSDFDIWVCVKKAKMEEAQVEGLARKLHEVENWAGSLSKFESHFFITDVDQVRLNMFGAADKESAGSALGKLLKEEFYRTFTVLAGHFPLWVLMPPVISDEEYERLRRLAFESHRIERGNYVDMGNVHQVTVEEAFGAAMWQLNKGIGSPFKSAMKMALIEEYMDPETEPVLLCDRMKEALTELAMRPKESEEASPNGQADPLLLESHPERERLDGYLLMFNRIQEYCRQKGRGDVLGILRKCFYLKAGTSITGLKDPLRTKVPRKDMLAEIIQEWEWADEDIADLNNYKAWSFDKRVDLGKEVNRFLIESYKRLKSAGASSKTMKINQTDMTVLGRKLLSFFSRKENKIEFLPKSFEDALYQERLTFSYANGPQKEGIWKVYWGNVPSVILDPARHEKQVIRSFPALAELVIWLVLNGVCDKDTQINLTAGNSPATAGEIQDLLFQVLDNFPLAQAGAVSNEDLLRESRIRKLMPILTFSGQNEARKVDGVELIYQTSWGEVYFKASPRNISPGAVLKFCLLHIPHPDQDGSEPFAKRLKVYVPSERTGQASRKIFLQFEKVLHHAAGNLPPAEPSPALAK